MCQQKTDARLFLEEYCKKYFPNRSYEIVPYHFNRIGHSVLERDDRVFYYGNLNVGDLEGNEIFYFDTPLRYSDPQPMFFNNVIGWTDVAFIGYMVTFEVSLQGGTIK